ncbi:MAG: methionyl-tRNA formyltransferase [Prevotellaceae bacterium]|jgi:methionyl-tRNA formyltransferase|nr:methionyl-tRNA formyltransferase [Prevotellaceae bacterium]
MRIVFMGTPDFAVESLKQILENKHNVVAVVTMPDKPAGRGHKIQFSPVKEFALAHNLPLLQPEKLKDEQFLAELRALRADIQVVVAFRMLPEVVWNMPKYGTFNLHASLLPQYRGAAPINWAIINGETETGATTFFLTHQIDTGKIILQEKISILSTDNAGTIHDKLMHLGAKMVCETLTSIDTGNIVTCEQSDIARPDETLKAAPKIFKDTCQLNLQLGVNEAHNFVRGLSPYPAAWTEIQWTENAEKTVVKIFETETIAENHNIETGKLLTDGKTFAKIALKDGFLQLKSVQMAGKKRMEIGELLRGLRQ